MSTGSATLPENRPWERDQRRRWFPRLRDAKIRSKLALLLVVPLTAVVVLAGIRLVTTWQRALDANLVRTLTELSTEVSALTQDLHKERMAAGVYLSDGDGESYNLRVRSTDERIEAYREKRGRIGDVPAAVETRLDVIDAHLDGLNGTRQEVLDRKQMPVAEAMLRYGVIITDLTAYGDVLGQIAGDGDLADALRAVAAFTRAKAATAEEEASVFAALSSSSRQIDEEQFASYLATRTSQQEALLTFTLTAGSEQRTLVEEVVAGDAVVLADQISTEVSRSVGQRAPMTGAEAAQAIGAVHDLMRFAEVRLEADLLARADQVRAEVVRQASIEVAVVLVALIVAIVLAVVLARSLNRSLRRLREGALAVANRDLPEAVNRLRDIKNVGDGGVDQIVREVRDPIRLSNRDEIGQVAQAFNVVHREAVRIAAEQAALRTSVSAMFLNLARRSQALVDRMIGELDEIERNEEDPKRLAKLFELDHLATRMRRNDENLLVLAGADSTAPRRDDALLVDVLRAAQSEVELYNRIEFGTIDPDVSVAAHAVNDVVRLLAELLDNATRFSPPTSIAVAEARRIRDYVIIQVEDRGLGMTDAQLEELNRRLADPPEMDVAAFRLMGLAVVGRLAARYDIRVELRSSAGGGTVAQVTLPSSIVVLPAPRSREQLLTRPRQPLAVESAPAATSPTPSRAQHAWSTPASTTSRTAAATAVEPSPPSWQAPTQGVTFTAPATVRAGVESNQPVPAVTHQLAPATAPLSGLPSGPVAGLGAALAATESTVPAAPPREAESGEAPIFREMEAVWFRTHGQDVTQVFTMPNVDQETPSAAATSPTSTASAAATAARPSLPVRTPGQSAPGTYQSTAAPAASGTVPSSRPTGDGTWRTAADEGWARASRAAEPTIGGTTKSGLPKRVPQAQLVPGGVDTGGSRERTRRTPDQVRGLLSAYHRGVQRGRSVGSEQYGTSMQGAQ